MKIAIIGSLWLDTPPNRYGGTEQVIYNLIHGLIGKGHDVTFFGPKNAKVPCRIIPTLDKPIISGMDKEWTDNANIHYHLLHITKCFDMEREFDVIHVHLNKSHDYMSLPLSVFLDTPVLFTIHFSPLYKQKERKERAEVLIKYKYLPYTSISNANRGNIPLNYIATIYNSLDFKPFVFSEEAEDYFVWIGKVNKNKGTKEAIIAAKKAGAKLKLMGAIDQKVPEMLNYWEEEVRPFIDSKQIEYMGEANTKTKVAVLGKAKAFLNPINWEEPFGMVMVESQAVGTPVIAFNRGAASEVIQDGKTGFLVRNVDEMVEKMKQVQTLSRRGCREFATTHFSIERMTDGYIKAYEKTRKNWKIYLKRQRSALMH